MADKQKSLDLMKAYEVLRMRLVKASNICNLEFVSVYERLGIKYNKEFKILYTTSSSSKDINFVNSHYIKSNRDSKNISIISPDLGIACLLNYSLHYNIFVGIINPIKLLKAGETLESLCIEYDTRCNA